jgi:hypothetical protein
MTGLSGPYLVFTCESEEQARRILRAVRCEVHHSTVDKRIYLFVKV